MKTIPENWKTGRRTLEVTKLSIANTETTCRWKFLLTGCGSVESNTMAKVHCGIKRRCPADRDLQGSKSIIRDNYWQKTVEIANSGMRRVCSIITRGKKIEIISSEQFFLR